MVRPHPPRGNNFEGFKDLYLKTKAKIGLLLESQGPLPESQGQDLALTVLYVPCSLEISPRSAGG